jgi:hypothetical protein
MRARSGDHAFLPECIWRAGIIICCPSSIACPGPAKVAGPVLASTIRLLTVAVGGWWLASSGAPAWTLFALVSGAMVVFGLSTVISIRLTRWGK